MLYVVNYKNETKYFTIHNNAYDHMIRIALSENINTSCLYVQDIGMAVYNSTMEPMVFEDYFVLDNLENFMYTNDFSFDDIYIEPKIAYCLIRSQPLYDF